MSTSTDTNTDAVQGGDTSTRGHTTRLIDKWFPCAEVTEASFKPFGSGRVEKSLMTWFAARPIAQARAAVLTSLLPWPNNEDEQERLKSLVLEALKGRPGAIRAAMSEVKGANPGRLRVLDVFSGRGIIPLEVARAGAEAWGIDYSPVATLAGMLLADFPFRDWTSEPPLPFDQSATQSRIADVLLPVSSGDRLARDVRRVLDEVATRYEQAMDAFYPRSGTKRPWGYLWAQTMPCDECRNYFPLVGSTVLRLRSRNPLQQASGLSFSINANRNSGEFSVEFHEGVVEAPTLISLNGKKGKVARCPFCAHTHTMHVVKARAASGRLKDKLLIVADHRPKSGYTFRDPSPEDLATVAKAEEALGSEKTFHGLSAVPDECIPEGNHDTVRGSLYGAKTYGDLCNARQTLGFVRLCRVVGDLQEELQGAGLSEDYIRALLGYAGSVIVRKLRYSTRGATLRPSNQQVDHIFKNQASLNYGFDYFEVGIGNGAGTWRSLSENVLTTLAKLITTLDVRPARIMRGSALHLPFKPQSVTAIITDPPYYDMIDYADASDLFFVWLKRALGGVFPELFGTDGLQEKDEEIIVKRGGGKRDHRTNTFYSEALLQAFNNARTVLQDDGVMTLVFGHGDPKAWKLLLTSLLEANFGVTASWPARTEVAGGANAATITNTITLTCKPAPLDRPNGLQTAVDLEVERAVLKRIREWEQQNMAQPDMRMASSGPAMEVVSQYKKVLRPDGQTVDVDYYLALGRRVVRLAAEIKVDGLPLETFDPRTGYALYWVCDYGREVRPKTDANYEALSADLDLEDVRRGILDESRNGYRLAEFGVMSSEAEYRNIKPSLKLIDTVRYMVRAWRADGGQGVANVLSLAKIDADDMYLWAVVGYLASHLPPADKDRKALEDITRNRRVITATRIGLERERARADNKPIQPLLPFIEAGDSTHGPETI